MTVYFRGAVLALTLILAACAGGPGAGKAGASPEAVIERRAVERWNHLIAGDFAKAYDFLTPGYRATRTREEYANSTPRGAVKWKRIEWRSASCELEEACDAKLILHYSVVMPQAGEMDAFTEVSEKWLKTGGNWYMLPPK